MVMGVSGCGKSTIGAALADMGHGIFLDGDDYHPQQNVDHMAAGKPLTDAMRWPWLDALADAVKNHRQDALTVFACSALKQSYRDYLRSEITDLVIIYLDASKDVIRDRLTNRDGHYMPASLLDSQYDTLEIPQNADVVVSADQTIASILRVLNRVV